MTTNPDNDEAPDAVEALLPWYAAGTLSAEDRRRVEAALVERPELAASLSAVEEDRAAAIALNERLGAPRREALARVLAVADGEPRRAWLACRLAAVAASLGFGAAPGRWAWAAAAAAVVIVVESLAIVSLLPARPGAPYQMASAPAPKGGAEVLIAFAPEARIDEISAFLKERGGSIEEGPRGGMYRVRFAEKANADMGALLKSLGESPLVRAALPAGGDASKRND